MIKTSLSTLRQLRKTGALPLLALILFQTACTVFFVWDVSYDIEELGGLTLALAPELAAAAGLVVGIGFELRLLARLRQKQADMAKGLRVAAGALDDLMRGYFSDWGLTPSEADVAAFTIKGYSIAEIASLRASAEGTIKTHLNAIYRKAGVAGRAQLVSLLVEDLFRAPLLSKAA